MDDWKGNERARYDLAEKTDRILNSYLFFCSLEFTPSY